MIKEVFAGEERTFELRPSMYLTGPGYETKRIGSLGDWALRIREGSLGVIHVQHIISHALAGPDNPVGLLKASNLVQEEMAGKPLAPYLNLATAIVVDAVAGE